MIATDLYLRAEDAAAVVRSIVPDFPPIAVVLGSGLGDFADRLGDSAVIPYARIPHFPIPTVSGHTGNLVVGASGRARVAALQGRFHYYEGHDLPTVTFPIRVLQRLGVRTLILTSATGGILPGLRPGDIVGVTDHLNLIGLNPLRGPNEDRLGTRFPDMTEVYSARLRRLASEEAGRLGFWLAEGVYACMPGPCYETHAEVRMLRTLGAGVVGMSTVPEAIVARHAGMEILALAVVSNAAAGLSEIPITHSEVLEAGRAAGPRLAALIAAVVERLVPGGKSG
jgi:purine-nucleoside phosphorylase